MIYVLSLNPSIDYHMDVDDIILGETNRSKKETMKIGGKGINVSYVLDQLGTPSTLVGFLGGDTGSFIRRHLNDIPRVQNKMIEVDSQTRINVKLKGHVETEINGKGAPVNETAVLALESFFNDIKENDMVIITGRIADGMAKDWYQKLAQIVKDKKAQLVVDIATQELISLCAYNPVLIKPNIAELESIFEVSISNEKEIVHYAQKLIDLGAQNCIVSLGSKGSMLVNGTHIYKANVPKGKLVNSVGAGDSMVAGFVHEYLNSKDIKKAYQLAAASGSATAYSENLAEKETIEELKKEIEIGA